MRLFICEAGLLGARLLGDLLGQVGKQGTQVERICFTVLLCFCGRAGAGEFDGIAGHADLDQLHCCIARGALCSVQGHGFFSNCEWSRDASRLSDEGIERMTRKLQTLKPRLATLGNRMQTIQPGSWRTSGQTSAQRGYGYKWQKAREGFLRSHPLCVMCEAEGRVTVATVVDHIVPHRGDQKLFWDKSNWQSLCKRHHDSDAQKKDNALSRL